MVANNKYQRQTQWSLMITIGDQILPMFQNMKKITLVKNFITKIHYTFVKKKLTFQILGVKIKMLNNFLQICQDFLS